MISILDILVSHLLWGGGGGVLLELGLCVDCHNCNGENFGIDRKINIQQNVLLNLLCNKPF